MNCKICNQKNKFIFNTKILNKYDIKYYHCSNCHFLQTEEPYWLDEAYAEPIDASDTGYMQRNIKFSIKLSLFLVLFFNKDAKFMVFLFV
jgi:protein-arginine kinase activator protein McsA